jgi:peroxiredoxin
VARQLNIDDRAPDFELEDAGGEVHRLSDYRGQPVVLVFYPHDFAPVCTKHHGCYMDVLDRYARLDAQVLGISVDSRFAHRAFARAAGITYPLLADFHPKGMAGRLYGVYNDELGHHNRCTFVIDPEGRISYIQTSELGEVPDVEAIAEAVQRAI